MNPAAAAAWRIKVLWKSRKGRRSTKTHNSTEHSLAAGAEEEAEKSVAKKD
jgi:hypothetical protein